MASENRKDGLEVTNCNDCRILLVDYERGELDAVRDAEMFAHLQACDGCRAVWRTDTELVDSLRSLRCAQALPPSVLAGVRQAMHAAPAPSFLEQLRAVLRPAIAAPVAAALIIGVGTIGYQRTHVPAPTLTGMDFVRQHVAQTAGLPSSDRAWSTYLLTSANTEDGSDAGSSQNG
jgi:anti-sigma factor RsiW